MLVDSNPELELVLDERAAEDGVGGAREVGEWREFVVTEHAAVAAPGRLSATAATIVENKCRRRSKGLRKRSKGHSAWYCSR